MHPGDRFVMFMIVHVTCQPQAMGHWICYIRSQCLFPSFGCVEFCFFLLGPSKKRCPGNKKLADQWVPRRISSTGSVNGMVLITFLGWFQPCYSFTILTLQTGRIVQTELKSVLSCRKLSCHFFVGMGIHAGKVLVFDGSHQWVAALFCPLL